MTTHLGITGTREGMTVEQGQGLGLILIAYQDQPDVWLHHGDCVGVDEQAHAAARKLGFKIAIHPPTEHRHRAMCDGDVVHPMKPYAERNRDIVLASDRLLVIPAGPEKEHPRSGTWMTHRMGLAAGVPTTVIRGDRW